MNNAKKITLGVGALSVLLATGAALSAVNAAENQDTARPFETEQTAVKDALDSGDYTAWSSAMTDLNQKRFDSTNENITEDTFNTLQEMKDAKDSGDFEKMKELHDELEPGFGMGMGGPGEGMRGGHGKGTHDEAVHEALENNDYEAWKTAVEESDHPHMNDTSEVTFNTMRDAHEARESGDHETAHELMEELHDDESELDADDSVEDTVDGEDSEQDNN